MTVLELKEALKDADDNLDVMIDIDDEFVAVYTADTQVNLQRQFVITTE